MGCDGDDQGCCKFSGKSSGWGDLGQTDSHSTSDLVSVGGQTDDQTQGSNQDDPDGWVSTLGDEAILEDVPDGGQRACHVTNLTSSVSEDDTAC